MTTDLEEAITETVPGGERRWARRDGLWARVSLHTFDVADAVTAAEALMLDRSQRRVAPVRLMPQVNLHAHTACGIDFGETFGWTVSNVEVERADGVRFDIGIGHYSLGTARPRSTYRSGAGST